MTNFPLPLVVDAVAKASLVLAITAGIAASLRRASASARHFVWTLGLVSALAAPALSAALPRWELPLLPSAASWLPESSGRPVSLVLPPEGLPPEGGSHITARAADGGSHMTASVILPREGGSHMTAHEGQTGNVAARGTDAATWSPAAPISWAALALYVWAAGATVILARMLLGLIAVQWMSRRIPEVTGAPWLAQARALASGLGLSRVRFLAARAGTMPMAWGIFRSSVLVPADADTWPAHRVRVVLLHELAHVKRRDCLTHLVAQLACAAYWFNPLVWMAARRLRTERERACDDLVLASGTRGSDYADQLLDIARVMHAGRFPVMFGGASLAMAQRSQLEGRLMAILDPSVPRRGLTRARALAAAVTFTTVIVLIASVQPWAEESAAVDAGVADAVRTEQTSPAVKPAERPIEQYAGQAEKDNRENAARQSVIQDAVQGALQAKVHDGVRDVAGVAADVTGGIVGGVVSAVAEGVAEAVAEAVGERHADRHQDKDASNEGSKGRARDPRTVNALMEALKDTDKEVRETAMNVLVQMRDPRMFEPLVAALRDSSADIREQAAFGLGQLRDVRAIEPLATILKDTSADVREQAVFALGQLRAAGAIDAITAALHDTSPSVREQAAFALSQIRDKRSIEPLISALKDENASVREQSAFALGQMRAAGAIEALVVALKDANPSVREQVAFALGQIRDPRAIDGLMVALKDTNASVRQQAAFALGQIR